MAEDEALAAATQNTLRDPSSSEAWEQLERLASGSQQQEAVVAAYREALAKASDANLASVLAQRAVQYCDEWFGGESARLIELLRPALALGFKDWAFQRLTAIYTEAERWDDLFGLYDEAIAGCAALERKASLLEEAAQCARDFAGLPDRAVPYLKQLSALRPSDVALAISLERLLERQQRWQELVAFWQQRLPQLAAEEAMQTRLRIVDTLLDLMDDPAAAVEELQFCLQGKLELHEAVNRLERIVAAEKAPAAARHRAALLLKQHYTAHDQPEQIIVSIEHALKFAAGSEASALHREVAERLSAARRLPEAMHHLAALLFLEPQAEDARDHLRLCAQETSRQDRFVEALVRAAEACDQPKRRMSLRMEAAELALEVLGRPPLAIEQYAHVLAEAQHDAEAGLVAARRLVHLYGDTGRLAERLDTLEQLATLEPHIADRRAALGDAARLSEQLGDVQRALGAWKLRLQEDEDDVQARDAIIDVLARAERWAGLAEALEGRLEKLASPADKRADLVRIATLHRQHLAQPSEALAAWKRVVELCGEDSESLRSIASLHEELKQWPELARLLAKQSGEGQAEVAQAKSRLADIMRIHLSQPENACRAYAEALHVDARLVSARQGLHALLSEESVKAACVETLTSVYRQTDEWRQLLSLIDHRVELCREQPSEAASVLLEASQIEEQQANDMPAALVFACRALILDPRRSSIDVSILRLTEQTRAWSSAAEAFEQAATALIELRDGTGQNRDSLRRIAELTAHEAEIRRRHLNDSAATFKALARLLRYDPQRSESLSALLQVAESLANWTEAEQALLQAAESERPKLEFWRLLADVQRHVPSRRLVDTLLHIFELEPKDCTPLLEAAELALRQLNDSDLTMQLCEQLFHAAARCWQLEPQSELAPRYAQQIDQATWHLVQLNEQAGRAREAYEWAAAASRLPLELPIAQHWRKQGARIARAVLKDAEGAAKLLEEASRAEPEDLELLENLVQLHAELQHWPKLLEVRKRQAVLQPDRGARLAVRLEIAQLVDKIEAFGGRIESLRENLAEHPGHPASLQALTSIFVGWHRFAELAELLAEQAKKLGQVGEPQRAAQLWIEAAAVHETQLASVDEARGCYLQAAELSSSLVAFDALARIYATANDVENATLWLERCLAIASEQQRVEIGMRLAQTHIASGHRHRAIAVLESVRVTAPAELQLRQLLAEQYRATEAWAPLASLLTEVAKYENEATERLQLVEEALPLYFERLDRPADAVPILRLGVESRSDDASLRIHLARALTARGVLDEARDLLRQVIDEFGRRGGADRAAAHVQLALVLQLSNEVGAALDELDIATRMNRDDAASWRMLARLAMQHGDLDRAEKSLRALLLLVRRQSGMAGAPLESTAEVLYQLHEIASRRGDAQQAVELLESSLEAAAQHEHELERLNQLLLERGQAELVMRALEVRLASVQDGAEQAKVYAAMARTLDTHFGRSEESLARWGEALFRSPQDDAMHDAAKALAARGSTMQAYAAILQSLMTKLQRKEDKPVIADLRLRLAAVLEEELQDTQGAFALYREVESSGHHLTRSRFALARLSAERGESNEQRRYLEQVVDAPAEAGFNATMRAQALYTLAQLSLQHEEEPFAALRRLEAALAIDADYARAAPILQLGAQRHRACEELWSLYRKVARASGDSSVLLEFLLLRSHASDVTTFELREAADVASTLQRSDKAKEVFERTVALAESGRFGMAQVRWALLGMADLAESHKSVSESLAWLQRAIAVSEGDEQRTMQLRLAALADQPNGDRRLAAVTLEQLLVEAPQDPLVWRPLVRVYRALGDGEGIQRLMQSSLAALPSAAERNELRLEMAKYLEHFEERQPDRVEILRSILLEDPDHMQASSMLVEIYERSGYKEDLVHLLQQQMSMAIADGNHASAVEHALRLGGVLEKVSRDEALSIYWSTFEQVPRERRILEALLRILRPNEDLQRRAQVMEQMLAIEQGARASQLAAEVFGLWQELDDRDGMQKALELGHANHPADTQLRDKLEAWYRERRALPQLAAYLRNQGERAIPQPQALVQLREAAALYRDELADAATCIEVLRTARRAVPLSLEILVELVEMLRAGDRIAEAVEEVGQSLQAHREATPARATLLRLRADLQRQQALLSPALADLEEAYAIQPSDSSTELTEVLHELRRDAAARLDVEAERLATLRLCRIGVEAAHVEEAGSLLLAWLAKHGDDGQAWHLLAELQRQLGEWRAMAEACERLVGLESGEEQAQSAFMLLEASEQLQEPLRALAGLEQVCSVQPTNLALLEKLRALYEHAGLHRQHAEALERAAEALSDDGMRFELLRSAGSLYAGPVGDDEAAIVPLRKALAMRPHDHEATLVLVDLFLETQRLPEASEILSEAIAGHKRRRSPELAALQHRMALVARGGGHRDVELEWLQAAHNTDKNNGEAAADLAWLAIDLNEQELALQALRAITLMRNEAPMSRATAFLLQARIAFQRGETRRAVLWARKAQSEDPHLEEISTFLAELGETA